MSTFLGADVVPQKSGLAWSSTKGFTSTRVWRGSTLSINALAVELQVAGVAFRITPEDGDTALLESVIDDPSDGRLVADTPVTTVWTLAGNDLEKDIFNSTAFTGLPVDKQANLRGFRADPADFTFTGTGATNANALLALINRGQESYTISTYVLRRTKMVSARFTSRADITNCGKQYTAAALISAEAPPSSIIPLLTDIGGAWLKRTPQIAQQQDGRYQIEHEWWYAETWSSLFYPTAA